MDTTVIGVYGGTFDPIHLGHLAVAEAVREAAGLDRVLFVPNRQQPLKRAGPWASAAQRLRMVQAAVADNPAFAVSAIELQQVGPSYTVDTLDALHRAWPDVALRFIMGTDAANALASWRSPLRILTDYRPIVMVRAGWPALDWRALESVHPRAQALIQLLDVPLLAIASRDLRLHLEAGRSVRYLIPDAVRSIIEEEGLYGVHHQA